MRIDLDALFAAAPTPYVLLDADLRIVWANNAYLDAVDRSRDSLIGRLLLEEFPAPADSVPDQMLRTSFRKVLSTGQTDHLPLIPYPIKASDGRIEERFWSATHTPIIDSTGRVEFLLQNTMDVTGLYRSEELAAGDTLPIRAAMLQRAEAVATQNLALAQMTSFFQSAFDQAPSFMAILHGPDHRFQIVNQSYSDLVGGRDVIGMPVRAALPDVEGQGFFELLDQVYTSGTPVSLKGMPVQFQTVQGGEPTLFYIDFIYHPLKDETGASIGIFAQGHDVTGQKKAEEELIASREKFTKMAQTMPNHVWTADSEGGLTWLNDQLYHFTGYNEGELYGNDWARAVHPDDLDEAAQNWTEAIQQGKEYEAEFRIRKADGSYRWHLVRAAPLQSVSGKLTGWVGTNTDIQDRKTVEDQIASLNAALESRVAKRNQELETLHDTLRQSQKMEAIGALAGGIAHDFNNLLQVINGNLEMTAREIPEGTRGRERLDQALKSVMRGATLASQLLSFARKQPLAPVVINLRQLLADTGDILSSAVGEGIEIDTAIADDLWNTNVDAHNLENAILNLAINARDAMNRQGKLTIHAKNVDLTGRDAPPCPGLERGQYVALAIEDTGTGIAPEVLERIFEPFFTTKSDGHGTGLGLSMVYGFAKQSGGHVTINSTLGSGSTITLYLPRTLADVAAPQPIGLNGRMGGHETILVVEDDDDVRDTAIGMLTDLGYHILQASDPESALGIVTGGAPIDLLFTDVIMPGRMTGHDLAEAIRDMRPDLPVLFTSGYVQDSIVQDGQLNAGIQLLGKPYTQQTLAQKIREVLGGEGKFIPQPQPVPAPASATTTAETTNPNGLRILLCEDDVFIRVDMADGLQAAGYDVLQAGSAESALALLQENPVDVLITDIGLPDQSGEDLATHARALLPDLPIIFATGGTDVPAASHLHKCRVITKPFRESDLLTMIGELC